MNNTTQTLTVTDDEIRTLSTEAAEHGDLDAVRICDAALAGNKEARRECVAAIGDAIAQHDREVLALLRSTIMSRAERRTRP